MVLSYSIFRAILKLLEIVTFNFVLIDLITLNILFKFGLARVPNFSFSLQV